MNTETSGLPVEDSELNSDTQSDNSTLGVSNSQVRDEQAAGEDILPIENQNSTKFKNPRIHPNPLAPQKMYFAMKIPGQLGKQTVNPNQRVGSGTPVPLTPALSPRRGSTVGGRIKTTDQLAKLRRMTPPLLGERAGVRGTAIAAGPDASHQSTRRRNEKLHGI